MKAEHSEIFLKGEHSEIEKKGKKRILEDVAVKGFWKKKDFGR
jgi:hypothetical protein